MKFKLWTVAIVSLLFVISMMASNALSVPQDDKPTRQNRSNQNNSKNATDDDPPGGKKNNVKAQPVLENEDEIPDSLINLRWPVQRTVPVGEEDLQEGPVDDSKDAIGNAFREGLRPHTGRAPDTHGEK